MIPDNVDDETVLILSGHCVEIPTEIAAALADAGWTQAHRALLDRAEKLTAAGKPLPLDLQKYVVTAARCGAVRGKGYKNFGRDVCIKVAIRRLLARGFSATRNAASEGESASSIVARALQHLGIRMTEAGVAKIWEREVREQKQDLLYDK
jgi:hypothetical protein